MNMTSDSVMGTYKRLPVSFISGSGAWLLDDKGNHYLDALAGVAVCGLGHAHPAVTEALVKQAGTLIHTSNLYEVLLQSQLAEKLCSISDLDKVFFCNSGAEANEAAIKICRRYAHSLGNSSPRIVVMKNSFHGRTLATLTATGNEKIKEGFGPLVEGFLHIPYDDISALKKVFEENHDIAAVMLEAIQGEGGIVVPSTGYLHEVADLCNDNNALLVLDEIQTGMCRTGKWFAFQHEKITPDVVTLAKSLGNGVPIGACLASERAANPMTPGSHGSTFGGNPLAASAALAVIDVLKGSQLDLRAHELGNRMLDAFRTKLDGIGGVVDVRGKGLMLGIELDRPCADLVLLALEKKLLINVTAGNVVRLLPPLTISNEECDSIITTVTDLIKDFLKE
jgi:acetylornithine aminotransferase